LHRQLLGTEQFGDCNDADEILARLGERRGVSPPVSERRGVSPPVSERRGVSPPVSAPPTGGLTPRRSSPRTSSDVWKVLDDLQKTQPERPKMFTGSFGMRFALIPGGKFSMGSALGECGRRDNEGPVHEVLLTRPFYLSITPVTQEQYVKVMGVNPSRFQEAAGGGPEHPVECVSWDDAVAFCARLSDLPAEKEAARAYRLPTEAEWEYACRAGSTTPFHGGDMLSAREASFDGNHPYGDAVRMPTAPRTVKVGSFAANYFGLYDMHGNVWEWCADWYDASYYQNSPRQDPPGPASGVYRVLRGGSWRNQAATCRSAYRNALASNQRQPFIGFRVVLLWEPAS
jgi:formylglycine-generating enzyme required for sulfatase activity